LGDLESRDNREITVTLRAVNEAIAGTGKAVGRGTMRTQSLFIPSNFDGPTINVGRVAGARVDAVSKGLTTTPGDTMYIPFIVRNPSNYPESFELRIVAPGAPQATVYADTNGDGRHQDGEPAVTQTAAPDPLEFVSSSPELSLQDMPGGGRGFIWRVAELAPGDTQVLQVTVRLRQNLAADAVITPRHTLTYQDSNSNAYRGQ